MIMEDEYDSKCLYRELLRFQC